MTPQPNYPNVSSGQTGQKDLYLGCLTKIQLILISAGVGLVVLLIIIIVPAVVLCKDSGSQALPASFSTGGDVLDFLVASGEISKPDGLLVTWFHRANSIEEMNKALASDAMILESDVTLEGYGTPNQKPIPIMAHPPNVHSDNTLDRYLDAVLSSRKAVKLDFKSLASVDLSLDLLIKKNSSRGISRPVWLNADILPGPNASPMPLFNGTRFLQLIEEKFPDVTLSTGWKVVYLPPILVGSYTKSMVNDMFDMIKDAPQKVTFPVYTLLARRGWQNLSWLLSQSPRFSLTMWQDTTSPNIDDLLFIRDNTHPARVYYDIYEPTLSAFKEAAKKQGRLRRFYPGGDLMDFLSPLHNTNVPSTATRGNRLAIQWFKVTDRVSLLTQLTDGAGGMLVVRVAPDSNPSGVPLVEGSGKTSEALTLQELLQLLGQRAHVRWGVYLQIQSQKLLEDSLKLLHSAYSRDELYRPIWIGMEGLQITDDTNDFVSAVERLFPYVTLVLTGQRGPPLIPEAVAGLSQRVALRLNAASLPTDQEGINSLTLGMMDRYDLVVEEEVKNRAETTAALDRLRSVYTKNINTNIYLIPDQS